jgi:hypothetical protein
MSETEVPNSPINNLEDNLKLSKWIVEATLPYIKGRTIEVQSGFGSIASLIIEAGLPIHLSESQKSNRQKLRDKLAGSPLARSLRNIDYTTNQFHSDYQSQLETFSTVIAVNIIDNGYYSSEVINNAKYLLHTQGRFIIILPTYVVPFEDTLDNFDEWNRLNTSDIKKHIGTGFKLIRVRPFKWANAEREASSSHFELAVLAIFQKR